MVIKSDVRPPGTLLEGCREAAARTKLGWRDSGTADDDPPRDRLQGHRAAWRREGDGGLPAGPRRHGDRVPARRSRWRGSAGALRPRDRHRFRHHPGRGVGGARSHRRAPHGGALGLQGGQSLCGPECIGSPGDGWQRRAFRLPGRLRRSRYARRRAPDRPGAPPRRGSRRRGANRPAAGRQRQPSFRDRLRPPLHRCGKRANSLR